MKKKLATWLFFVFFILVFDYCKTDNIKTGENREWGEASALRNGSEWQSTCVTRINVNDPNKFSLGFNQYNSQNYRRNSFNFRNVPYSVGNYFPFQFQSNAPDSLLTISFFTLLDDGDVIGDKYNLLHDSIFYLSINSIDYQTGIVQGKFGGHLVKVLTTFPEKDPSSSDTLIFENGVFKARVID